MNAAIPDYFVRVEVLLFLLNVAVASCLACGLGLLAARFLRNRPAPVRHGLLVAVLIVLVLTPPLLLFGEALGWGGVCLPFATQATSARHVPHSFPLPRGVQMGAVRGLGAPDSAADALGRAWDAPPRLLLGFQAVGTFLVVVWGLGIGVILVGFLRGLGTLAVLGKTLTEVKDPALSHMATETFERMGLRQRVGLYGTPLPVTPFSLWLVRPLIILPEGLAGHLDSEQLAYVLVHEAAHIRRRDHWVSLLQYWCEALWWWNPLVRGVSARLVRLREQICDDNVIRAGGDGRRFAQALVRIAEWGALRPAALCSVALLEESGDELQERILRLVRQKQPQALRMTRASIVAIAMFAVLVSATVLVSRMRAAPPPREYDRAGNGSVFATDAAPSGPRALAGDWRMYLPAGFVHSVSLLPMGTDHYRLEPKWLNSSGVYEVRDGRLVIVEPNDRRLLGFEWAIGSDGQLALVGQPPLEKTGANYVGARMLPSASGLQ